MSNQVPEGWVQSNLGTLVGIQSGNAFKSEDFVGYGIPVIRISNIKTSGHVSLGNSIYAQFSEKLERFKVGNGDILIAMSGATTGKVGRYKSNDYAYLNQRVGKFVNKNNNLVSMDYVHHITSKDSFIESVLIDAVGGAQPNISNNQIESIQVLFPPLPEQQKIAAILTSVDDVIEKTQAQINKLKDLKTGMMQELLTCGVGVDGKPHTEFKDSPVGRIPKGWDVDIIGNLFLVQLGKMLSKASKVSDSPMPYLGNKNIQWGRFALDDIETMDFTEKEKHKFSLKRGDLLMCEGGEVGRCAIWMDEITNCYYQKAIHRLRPINSMYDPVLLMEYMKFAKQSGLLVDYISQTSIAHLTKEKLVSIPVPVPTQVEQQEIVMILKAISKRINSAELKLSKNIQLKKALMQDLLTGKVRVNVD
ncbi:TPA: restriction endonuclease subunit S [Photobacterium damselae]